MATLTTEDLKQFCMDGAPFTPVKRFTATLAMAGYAVRSRIGEDVAICDNPDQAEAIAAALNAQAESKNPKRESLR